MVYLRPSVYMYICPGPDPPFRPFRPHAPPPVGSSTRDRSAAQASEASAVTISVVQAGNRSSFATYPASEARSEVLQKHRTRISEFHESGRLTVCNDWIYSQVPQAPDEGGQKDASRRRAGSACGGHGCPGHQLLAPNGFMGSWHQESDVKVRRGGDEGRAIGRVAGCQDRGFDVVGR